ncbi:MAG: hypothetical protein ABSG98_06210 [Anaerolineales bacterium]
MPDFDPTQWPGYAQPLLFGTAHLWTRPSNGRKWKRKAEWTFYPDNLPPATLAKLRRHFDRDNRRMGDWHEPTDSPGVKAYLLALSDFLAVFYGEAVSQRCLIVGFNLPFDLSRLAFRVGPARSQRFRGGFSFILWRDPTGKHAQNLYRPRLYIKQLGDRSTLMGFSTVKLGADKGAGFWRPQAELLDLGQLCTALLGEPHSLDRACKAFGLDIGKAKIPGHGIITLRYVRYNRQDTLITAALAFAALDRFDKHPISRGHRPPGPLSECSVFSGASIAKAYLRIMGIAPRMTVDPNFPRRALAAAMQAYYGGRTESWIWGCPVPVAPLDFVSMYPTVATLQHLWPIITAKIVKVVECPEEIQRFLETVTPEDLFEPEKWPELNGFARIRSHGDIVPVRARYQLHRQTWKIGANPYRSEDPQWYAIADLVASRVRGGPVPNILEAFRLAPGEAQPDLRPVLFAGTLTIDPAHDDFFKRTVEERAKMRAGLPPYAMAPAGELEAGALALKIIANAGSYGIYAEVNKNDLAQEETRAMNLWSGDGGENPAQSLRTSSPEIGGPFFFPPLAALTTAGARLFLALLQQAIESLGASYALCDTDSMFVTFHPDGGILAVPEAKAPIRLLTPADLKSVHERFNRLNPYDRRVVPSLLKHEYSDYPHLLALSIAPKRYALLTPLGDGVQAPEGEVVARSESALGAILPTVKDPDWITAWWEAIARSEQSLPFPAGPLVRKYSVQTWETLRHFRELNRGRPYQEQIKPFNFLLTAQPDPLLATAGGEASPLVAPFNTDPASWLSLPWYETHTGRPVSITLDPERAASAANQAVCVETIGAYFTHYRNFKPSEFRLPPGDRPGLLRLRPVRRCSITFIGKESTALAELDEAGLPVSPPFQIGLPGHWIIPLLPLLADLPASQQSELCEQLRVDPRTLRRWIHGSSRPANNLQPLIESACVRFADEVLGNLGMPVPEHPANTVALYTSLAPTIRENIRGVLRTSVQKTSGRATALRLNMNRRTLQDRIAHPERIPLGILPLSEEEDRQCSQL